MQQKEEIWNSNSMKANKDLAAKRMFERLFFLAVTPILYHFLPKKPCSMITDSL